jgi:acyl-coenzyme A synthetase/AMP-(fatty) acid ligase
MTRLPPPERLNVSEYFLGERIAAGQEARRALLTDAGAFTYGDVQRLANRYGNALLAAGVRPEERVLLALPDGVDFVGAFFGALRMGGVVIMLNPELGREQVRYFYEYTGARAILVDAGAADAFREAAEEVPRAPRILAVGGAALTRDLDAASEELDPWPTHRDDPAIWLFSGGTTGEPKGVVQPHRSYVNTTVRYGHGILGMAPDDVTISVPKLFFGYATGINLLFPFSVGATAALFPERCTPATLFEKIERFRPTVLVNVPTMVGKLLAEPGADARDLSSLRLATSAGEALPAELSARSCRATTWRCATRRGTRSPAGRSGACGCAAAPARSATGATTRRRWRPSGGSGTRPAT